MNTYTSDTTVQITDTQILEWLEENPTEFGAIFTNSVVFDSEGSSRSCSRTKTFDGWWAGDSSDLFPTLRAAVANMLSQGR
jgi:hypothetical protein